MTSSSEDRMCKLTYRSFSCSKRMLKIVRENEKKSFFCKIDDSECLAYMCNYAECRERKLNDTGMCMRPRKLPQSAQTARKRPSDQYLKYDYMTPNDLDVKLRKKLSRKR